MSLVIDTNIYIRPVTLDKLIFNHNIATGVERVVSVPRALLKHLWDERPLSLSFLVLKLTPYRKTEVYQKSS